MHRYQRLDLSRSIAKDAFPFIQKRIQSNEERLNSTNSSEASFSSLIQAVTELMAMSHLEFKVMTVDLLELTRRSCAYFTTYLYKDWWKGTQHELLNHESINKDRKYKRKRDSNDLTWFYSGRMVALQAALFSDVEMLQKIADWCEPWMLPEPRPLGVDPLFGKAFLVLLNDFRTQGKFDVTKLETELKASRKKGPKLLYNLWCAVREKDQAAFEKLAIESVQQFEKTMPSERFTALDQVDIDTSLFVAVGRLKGMDLPDFPEQTLLRLLTYETVTAGESKAKPKKKKWDTPSTSSLSSPNRR